MAKIFTKVVVLAGFFLVSTILDGQVVNGIPNAAAYPGSDPCEQVNNAIAALPPRVSTVDARSFTPAQLATPCRAILSQQGVVGLNILFGSGTWQLNGCPAINNNAGGLVLQGQGQTVYQAAAGTQFKSGSSCPQIANYINTLHGADGLTIRDIYVNCNHIGTFGVFAPASYDMVESHVRVSGCTSAGNFVISGRGNYEDVTVNANGGDGWVIGFDNKVYGKSEAIGNGKTGYHVVSGGNVFTASIAYQNGLHNWHDDRNLALDWAPGVTYIEPKILTPVTDAIHNRGGYSYYSQVVGTTGGSHPNFCQGGIGCTTTDGSVVWINVGTAQDYGFNLEFHNHGQNQIDSGNFSQANQSNTAGMWCNLTFEGLRNSNSTFDYVSGLIVHQSEVPSFPAAGICLVYSSTVAITGYQFYGSSTAGFSNNDLGALLINNSRLVTINGMQTYQSYGQPISLVSSHEIFGNNLLFSNTGVSGDSIYAINVDANSSDVDFNGIDINDSRTPPYSKGISNAAGNAREISFQNVLENGLVASPDSFSGAFLNNYTGGIAFAALPPSGNGSTVYCTDCTTRAPASCTVAAPANCVCASGGTGALAKRIANSWYCGGL